jgi:hypothetical protein
MVTSFGVANWLFGLVGAVVGGAVGYFAFFWMAGQGFYAMVVPGALLGLGCGAFSGGMSYRLGAVCGLLGLILEVVTEWRRAPFMVDDGLWYFVTHMSDLTPLTLVAIGAGGFFAFWFGRGRDGGVWKRTRQADNDTGKQTGVAGS